jgi:hypothetical protein
MNDDRELQLYRQIIPYIIEDLNRTDILTCQNEIKCALRMVYQSDVASQDKFRKMMGIEARREIRWRGVTK